jgi:ribonuclease HI
MTEDDPDLAEVVALELRLLDPAVRATPSAVEVLLHPDFREVGASGRLWERESIVEALGHDPGQGSDVSGVDARFVSDDVVLITYRAQRRADRRVSLRSSLWVSADRRWRCLYHQGTIAA